MHCTTLHHTCTALHHNALHVHFPAPHCTTRMHCTALRVHPCCTRTRHSHASMITHGRPLPSPNTTPAEHITATLVHCTANLHCTALHCIYTDTTCTARHRFALHGVHCMHRTARVLHRTALHRFALHLHWLLHCMHCTANLHWSLHCFTLLRTAQHSCSALHLTTPLGS